MKRTAMPLLSFALFALLLIPGVSMATETGMITMLDLTGARQTAMGETGALFNADPFNLEYNPAAITGLISGKAGISYNNHFQDRYTNTLAIIFPAKGMSFGAHLRLSSTGDIEARGDHPTSEPLYLFDDNNFAAKIFAAKQVTNRLQAGVSVGYLLEKIDTYRASTAAFGFGAIYKLDYGIGVHASVSNLGGTYTFISEKQKTPAILRVGAGYSRKNLSASADYVNIKSGDGHVHMGGEYCFDKVLFLRAGYQTGYDTKDFSAGAGFVYKNVRIDYAFVPYDSDLGNSHRFSLTIALR